MTAVIGVNATKLATPIGANVISQGYNKGQLCYMHDTYEASALANASTITVFDKLPVGAVVHEVVVMCDDMGSTVTIDVGDADDADRYINDGNCTTANTVIRTNCIDGFGYKVLGTGATASGDDTQVIATTAGIFGGSLKFSIIYSV